MDPLVWTYVTFFLGGIARPLIQYGLARIEDGAKFDVRYIIPQIAGVILGFLSLLVVGNLPDVPEIIKSLGLPGFLFYVASFAYGYMFASLGRQGDKVGMVVKRGSYKIPPK